MVRTRSDEDGEENNLSEAYETAPLAFVVEHLIRWDKISKFNLNGSQSHRNLLGPLAQLVRAADS